MNEDTEWNDDDVHYGLVMPFIVCQSHGGPYQDEAFVAGMRLGQLYERLRRGASVDGEPVEATSVPQLDLMAMHFGYTLVTVAHDDYWTLATLTPGL